MSVRVLIVDDHKIVREGLRSLLAKEPDIEVVGEAESAYQAIDLAEEMRPDLVLMDIVMPGLNGIEATRLVLAKAPTVKVIALSMYSERQYVIEMLRAGACGYLLKDCALEQLGEAIRTVAQGRTYITQRITDVIIEDYTSQVRNPRSAASSVLTSKQYKILQLLAEGNSTREIALRMALNTKTVESHRRRIMQKLNIHTIAGLTKYAIRDGLVSADA